MRNALLYAMTVVVGSFVLPAAAFCQDFHVRTTVFNEQGGRSHVVARSLSLFHGNKTYDFIHEVGEVIVFEPSVRKFTLLNTRQMKATTVVFEELNGQLKVARETLQGYLEEFPKADVLSGDAVYEQLLFQLDPRFEHSISEDGKLVLKSNHMWYQAKFEPIDATEKVDAYLHYADWMCRLNYVLHPGPILPDPRLVLNAELRKVKGMPTEVELIADIETRIHRRAEHKIYWNLDQKDRDLIHQWEKLLASEEISFVTFQEYQRALLISQAERTK